MAAQTATSNGNKADTKKFKIILYILAATFILGNVCNQAFNLVFLNIGDDLGAPEYAALITSIPGIVLGIICFIYGSLGDFVSLRKMMTIGLAVLVISSVAGFFLSFNIWLVIIMRCFQTAGAQVAGSVYLVMTARYLEDSEKATFFGVYNAAYQSSVLIGILAGGVLTTINWTFLFLIPAITVVFVPFLIKNIPNSVPEGNVHIDIPGFVIVGIAIAFITLYFTDYNLLMLAGAAIFFIIFAVYISKAKEPFITVDFFKNKRWLIATLLVFIFYFYNYSITPTMNALGTALFNFTSAQVSYMLIPGLLTSLVVSLTSGAIINKIGRSNALMTGACLIVVGFFATAFFVNTSPIVVAICSMIFYAGLGLIYSPIYDTVTGTVPTNEAGRVLGMNDLVLNTTASIGVSVFAPFMIANPYAGANILGKAGDAAGYSNLFLIFGSIALVGLIVFFFVRKSLEGKAAK